LTPANFRGPLGLARNMTPSNLGAVRALWKEDPVISEGLHGAKSGIAPAFLGSHSVHPSFISAGQMVDHQQRKKDIFRPRKIIQ